MRKQASKPSVSRRASPRLREITTNERTGIREALYLAPPLKTREDLERFLGEFWDATSAHAVGDCPRKAEYRLVRRLVPAGPMGEPLFFLGGRAIHAMIDTFYCTGSEEIALNELRRVWGRDSTWAPPATHKYAHLHLGHLEVVSKNYFEWSRRHDSFQPLRVHLDEIDFTDVVGAQIRLAPDRDLVILGESKLVMKFSVNGETLYYAGKPDLPIVHSGAFLIMDNKATNSFLSGWYFEQFKFSNQLRGYCAMLEKLLGKRFAGASINGVYIGEKASAVSFAGTRFHRYGPMYFQPSHLDEAIHNQYHWKRTFGEYRARSRAFAYGWPQNPGRSCQGCEFAPLCEASPRTRELEIAESYQKGGVDFLDL